MMKRRFSATAAQLVSVLVVASIGLVSGCGFPTSPGIGADAYELNGNLVEVLLAKVPELDRVGGSVSIVSERPQVSLVIARTGEDNFVVVSNGCTHKGKSLGYDHDVGLFKCASGKSHFALDGTVVKGPAEKPLRTHDCHVEGDRLIIDLTY